MNESARARHASRFAGFLEFWSWPGAEEQNRFQRAVVADARLSFEFLVLTLASAAIATFGLLENNVAVIIGAMIVAPLILPIGSLSYAVVSGEVKVLHKGAIALLTGSALSVVLALAISRVIFLPTLGSEIMARSQPNLMDLGIALVAGLITAFARIRPGIAGSLAGTAIAVALMPPLCVVGIALGHAQPILARGAALLFVTNLLGIMLASMCVYVVAGYVHVRRARGGFAWIALCTAAVAIPLVVSTNVILRESRLEAALRSALVNGTSTFHRAELVDATFNWVAVPAQVHLLVRSDRPITPLQVRLLEAYAKRATGRDFTFVFDVAPVQQVLDTPATPTSAP
jgi:uncharacterized hydrophobic protein (TIGR00271 family)